MRELFSPASTAPLAALVQRGAAVANADCCHRPLAGWSRASPLGAAAVMYADTAAGRSEAMPGVEGTCPACGHPVRPKCGSIVAHHWAHHARKDCDPWSEPESEWHRGWKQAVPAERREVVMGQHRADIVTASGGVVEIQHSPISPEVIEAREAFYGERMAWIFDGTGAFKAGRVTVEAGPDHVPDWDHLTWSHARRSIEACKRPVLVDLGDGTVLHLQPQPVEPGQEWAARYYGHAYTSLHWCRLITRESVEAWMRDGGRWEVRRAPAPPPPAPRREEPPAGSVMERLAKAGRWSEGTPAMKARREHSARLIVAMARWRATGRPEDWAAYVTLARHAAGHRPPGG